MRHHARAQTLPLNREHAKHRAKCDDGDHCTETFIAVRCAEEQRRHEYAEPQASAAAHRFFADRRFSVDGCELLQEITAKHKFFNNACRGRERNPHQHFPPGLWGNREYGLLLPHKVQHSQHTRNCCEHDACHEPEDQSDAEIREPSPHSRAPLAQQLSQGNAAHPDAPPGQHPQRDLPCHRECVMLHVVLRKSTGLRLCAAHYGDAQDHRDHNRRVPPGRDRLRWNRPPARALFRWHR